MGRQRERRLSLIPGQRLAAAVGCSGWSAGNPANLYSFAASNVGDRAVEWRIIDFQFVRQQPKPYRPYAEKVKLPGRVVIQDQGVFFMLLYLVLRFHFF
jgi:hypothetical protein